MDDQAAADDAHHEARDLPTRRAFSSRSGAGDCSTCAGRRKHQPDSGRRYRTTSGGSAQFRFCSWIFVNIDREKGETLLGLAVT
ncbi:hypothetical protein, partial [Antarcticimicrobium luteum]|uniref:hypothetical protein n=1 Tax=Antarcticimicrobium luteum TaxID=2547397 RepID=UPI00197F8DFF